MTRKLSAENLAIGSNDQIRRLCQQLISRHFKNSDVKFDLYRLQVVGAQLPRPPVLEDFGTDFWDPSCNMRVTLLGLEGVLFKIFNHFGATELASDL